MSRPETSNQPRETTTLWNLTGLGRPVDPRVPSNRLAIIGTLFAGLVVTAVNWASAGSVDLATTFSTVVAVFLAWAIGRELDPDNPRSAALGMALSLAAGLIVGAAALGAMVVLIGLRILVGSVGRQLTAADYVVVVGVATFAGTHPSMWPSALLLAVALLVDRPRHARLLVATLIGASVTGAALWSPAIGLNGSLSGLVVATLGVLASLAALPGGRVRSTTDSGNSVISSDRVALARLLTGVVIATSALIAEGSISALVPVLSALGSVAIFNTFADAPSRGTVPARVAQG